VQLFKSNELVSNYRGTPVLHTDVFSLLGKAHLPLTNLY